MSSLGFRIVSGTSTYGQVQFTSSDGEVRSVRPASREEAELWKRWRSAIRACNENALNVVALEDKLKEAKQLLRQQQERIEAQQVAMEAMKSSEETSDV